ncbi:LysR family transcriptional regulator [Massilia sp. S19_KUP03_FR1]|uniref:LysR family transcriptional regulator n=1 Tax=Massilia sp. S19_KUP03_FR1 TaxID=3025503 RepID=UPI002FCDD5F4
MLPSERLKGLDVFVSVVERGSFASAAERLNLTSSAVSKSIARLEKRLQARLFARTTRKLALTDAGSVFYQTCLRVLADLEEVETQIGAEYVEPTGRVRIDLPASFGQLHALPVILAFIADHHLLMPHISMSDHFVDLVEERIDIVVRIGGPNTWPTALGHRYLGAERLIFCASPAYLARRGTPQLDTDLEQHDRVVYGRSDGLVNSWLFAGAGAAPLEQRVMPGRIAVGDAAGQVAAILAGLGIAQLPTWAVKQQVEQGLLVEVLPQLATDGLPINLVWLKSRQYLPKVKLLLDVLANSLTPSGRV